jgi:hypothetical protein
MELRERLLRGMTTYDFIMLGVVGPAVLIPAWVVVLRIWRQGRDIYDQAVAVKWMTPESARHGYHAFLLPAVLGFTVMWPMAAVYVVWGSGGGPQWVGDVVRWGFGVGLGLMLLACWLWAFMWPRFLVPPHLRGQRGWAVAVLRGESDGDRAESAAEEPHR